MGNSEQAGVIELALNVVGRNMNQQISSMANKAAALGKKAFAGVGAILGTASVVAFTKSCLQLGSDLNEVQNVVDVTFGDMSESVNKFAQSSLKQFGLSETSAKKMMGTYGAMNKAFGFGTEKTYEMAKAVTGLTADVSSFYNLSQDMAATKLKSIWTGETESLKELGVVMSQTALDQYALNNGFGKTTVKMTEQEKVLLRYQYVMSRLSDSMGDFARTSDGWANQTRVLNLQFEQIKATLGQGFINLFTPILKVMNDLLARLQLVANGFQKLTVLVTGKNQDLSGTYAGLTDGINSTSDAIEGTGDAAVNAAKKASKALMGFDQINKLSDTTSSGASSGGGTDVSSVLDSSVAITESKVSNIQKMVLDTKKNFKEAFEEGSGGANLDKVRSNIRSIREEAIGILKNDKLQESTTAFSNSLVTMLGNMSGAITSIGISIEECLTGGISKWFSSDGDKIAGKLSGIYDSFSRIQNLVGDLSVSVADFFTVLKTDDAQSIVSSVASIVFDMVTAFQDLQASILADGLSAIFEPFIENEDSLRSITEDILAPLAGIFDKISGATDQASSSLKKLYKSILKPAFDVVKELFDDYLKSDSFQGAMSSIVESLDTLEDSLDPLLEAGNKLFAIFAGSKMTSMGMYVTVLGTIAQRAFALIVDGINNTVSKFTYIVSFVSSIINGDWKGAMQAAWNYVKVDILKIPQAVMDVFGINGRASTVFENIGTAISNAFQSASAKISNIFRVTIPNAISSAATAIRNTFSTIPNWLHSTFQNAWNKVLSIFSKGGNVFSGIQDGISSILKNSVNGLITGINSVISTPFRSINSMLNKIKQIKVLGIKPFDNAWSYNPIAIPSFPKLAKGGVVNQPTLAMVGEAGREAVMPLENNTGWIDELATRIALKGGGNAEVAALLKQLIELVREGGDTVLYLGDEEVARSSNRGAAKLIRRYGSVESS